MIKPGRFLVVALGFLVARILWAHDPGLSTGLATVRIDGIEVSVAFAPADIHLLLPATARLGGQWKDEDFERIRAQLDMVAPEVLTLRAGGQMIPPRDIRVELAAADSVNFTFRYPRPAAGPLEFRAVKLGAFVLPPGHREYFSVTDESGNVLVQKLLSASDPVVVAPLGESPMVRSPAAGGAVGNPAGAPTFWGFLKLGIEHIWTGYDHLLFLFGLLVVCRTFKSIVAIISCFTLAHSITLALATMEIVNLPSRLVEPAIAASIVFVGAENLVRRGSEPRGRWALTFFFGLIHGFGFASVLRELGVGQGGRGLAMPLFTFNLGVEIGQVAVAAVVLPIVWRLRKNDAFLRRGVPALSLVVALAGAYWFLERTVLG
jgi:hydrogenase/urease accessory protein HupE